MSSKICHTKGHVCVNSCGAVHRDPELYANPNEFDPKHFSVEEVEARETASFLGFGDGPRNCVGARFGKLQSHIALALLVKNYRLSLASPTPQELKADIKSFMIVPDGDIFLNVAKI